MLADNEIRDCLALYGADANPLQCDQVRAYIALLLKWNRAISLTTVTDEAEILRFHFGEAVFALSAIRGINGRLADVGTGAGFPGIPLRVFNDRIELTLIESNAKKCAFLNEVMRQIGLDGTRVLRARYEDSSEVLRANINTVVARALGRYEELLNWSYDILVPEGRVVLWIGERGFEEIGSSDRFSWLPRIPIPGSKRRFLLVGSRMRNAPAM
jgi:16S rRNA (guanine527-N7)-methyltransferase